MGAQLAKLLLPKLPADCELLAVGTNVLATSAMLKAGAVRGATGENAVVYNAARADIILGPIGILMANGIMGEVSPKMSVAISGSEAAKVLIPASGCGRPWRAAGSGSWWSGDRTWSIPSVSSPRSSWPGGSPRS